MHTTPTIPNLPPAVTYDVLQTLRTTMPPPDTGSPDDLESRFATAMAVVIAYQPRDVAEALLAAQIVACDASGKDALRLGIAPDADADTRNRCRAQAAGMFRLAQSGLRSLQRSQALRDKAEDAMHPSAMGRAGWWFRDASVPEPEPPPDPARTPEPEPRRAAPLATDANGEPIFDAIAEAEHYVLIYPDRAALIRAHGGLPRPLTFGPPEPAIVDAIVRGASPALRDRLTG
jgi:hypothetical protein